jgi:hypothetical protein
VVTLGLAEEPQRPTVGAIRWDAWFAAGEYQRFLAPEQWHSRLPFYATVEAGNVVICSDTQETLDKEIEYASRAGLDYWAFVYYYPTSWPGADNYNYGLKLYLASRYKEHINFCLILQGWHLGPEQKWPETARYFAHLFAESTYQTVLDGRPLVYMLYVPKTIELFGGSGAAKQALGLLREETLKAGLKNPYLVAQVFDVNEGSQYVQTLGFDAVGAYTSFGYGARQIYPLVATESSNDANETGSGYPYESLVRVNRDFWETCREAGLELVPTMNAGWDWRPRLADKTTADRYKKYSDHWFSQPTPRQLAEHLDGALNWVVQNRMCVKAWSVLVYAWNESDEGGWLVPTRSEGTARLDEVKKVLTKSKKAVE